ncbi:hypothetical protein [Methylibium petroleiphilum]|uniref:Transmembrane protein n=1 Tax=Methylibium petroleiphilum (strain ATCC BAA-1232 / LMG 22953 / PM1) TaxID=420662 RepID=A2SMW5_METPP|nr:hypothetical protein [Methylibium petroleiphilum]ABM96904.1 hypothetical protein Mpe_B0125 [Methylibium petroleiphilum PM1]
MSGWEIAIALLVLAALVLTLRLIRRGGTRRLGAEDARDTDITSRVFDPRFRLDKDR